MAVSFPTKHELRCAGISFILSHILFGIAWVLISLWDYDIYDVENDEDVIKLHNAVSSPNYRLRSEISVTLVWISFPLLLIGLYGLKKMSLIIYGSTSAEMYIYLFEKAYIIWITVATVLIPAIVLVLVSYDWSFDEPGADGVPTGYYIQLFVQLLEFELIDCVAVADAVFMISLSILSVIIFHGAYSKKQNDVNAQWRQYVEIMHGGSYRLILQFSGWCCTIALFIVFIVILFEFAESGFFSITGHAKFLLVWVWICKIFMGVRLIQSASDKTYSAFKKAWEMKKSQQNEKMLDDDDGGDNYEMEQIQINTEDNNELND